MKVEAKSIEIAGQELTYIGRPLSEKKLPAIFYFALTAQQSLELDPINQPAAYLQDLPLRIYSLTLPCHDLNKDPNLSMHDWSNELSQANNIIEDFIESSLTVIEALKEEELIDTQRCAVMGLSRGAFIACHLAAKIDFIHYVLGFSPLSSLKKLRGLKQEDSFPLIDELSLNSLTDKLYTKAIRFYIGNRDLRVGTENSFSFIQNLSEKAYQEKIRSSPFELIIGPSLGHMGHGTSQEVFESGARWLKGCLAL